MTAFNRNMNVCSSIAIFMYDIWTIIGQFGVITCR